MWSRRRFLQHSSLALAMTSLRAGAKPASGPLGRPIGLQIYTVRDAASKDLPRTLQTIAEIGYGEIELSGPPSVPVEELRRLLTSTGLSVPSMHTSMRELQEVADQRIDYAKALGIQYLVCSFPWTADGRFDGKGNIAAELTLDDWKWNAEQLNRWGERARKAGLRFGYHNHNMEFRSYAGRLAFDELLRLTDAALVTMELDIGWVVTAGQDPVALLRKHADRISLLHVKDVRKDLQVTNEQLKPQTTEVGSGAIDWKRLFGALKSEQIRHYFVEQENFDVPSLQAVKTSFEYLRKLGQ